MTQEQGKRKELSLLYWEQQYQLEPALAVPVEGRWIGEEYTWEAHPDEGFVFSHDKPEDHDGVETVVFSRLWVETGSAQWATTGTTSTIERLVIEDLEAMTFRPEEYNYPPRHEKMLAGVLFGRHAVPRLGDIGQWKRADDVRKGDVIVAFESRSFVDAPRTVLSTERDYSDRHWGPRTRIAWEEGLRRWPDSYMSELSWVAVAKPSE